MKDKLIGRKNITFGWLWLLLFILLGVFLEIKLSDPHWGVQGTRVLRKLLKDAHAHGIGLAIINIIYGFSIDGANLADGIKNQGAWLAILGGALFPVSMLLTIVSPPLFFGTFIAAFFLFIALWIIIVGYIRRNPLSEELSSK